MDDDMTMKSLKLELGFFKANQDEEIVFLSIM